MSLEWAIRPLQEQRMRALAKLRESCLHPVLYECEPQWEHEGNPTTLLAIRICTQCGVEEESWGGTEGLAWKALDARRNDSAVRVVSRNRVYKQRKDDGRVEVAWCYGDREHPGHPALVSDLTKASGTRCKGYEGFFDGD